MFKLKSYHLIGIFGNLPDSVLNKFPEWLWRVIIGIRIWKCTMFHEKKLEFCDVTLESRCKECGFVHARDNWITGEFEPLEKAVEMRNKWYNVLLTRLYKCAIILKGEKVETK